MQGITRQEISQVELRCVNRVRIRTLHSDGNKNSLLEETLYIISDYFIHIILMTQLANQPRIMAKQLSWTIPKYSFYLKLQVRNLVILDATKMVGNELLFEDDLFHDRVPEY